MTKIILFLGKEGSGKTTLANSFASVMSKNVNTLLISANTNYGISQKMLNTTIDSDENIYLAFINSFDENKYFKRVSESKKLYVSGMSDYDDITAWHEIQNNILENEIDNLLDRNLFDFIIVDGTSNIADDLTYPFVKKADIIINTIESSLQGIFHENATKKLNESKLFKDKKILNILNKHIEKIANKETIERAIEKKIDIVIEHKIDIIKSNFTKQENIELERKLIPIIKLIENEEGIVLFKKERKGFLKLLRS